jgi:3-deoxy-7-phosphoheptulonate synthase
LRGGDGKPNYSLESIAEAAKYLKAGDIANPSVIVDVSHDNCLINGKKDYSAQPNIVLQILDSLKQSPELKLLIKGFMLESFIKPGNQNVETANPIDMGGLSITDPCLGWDETEKLIKEIAAR